jgi:lipopolysaccharide biosynthesis regulator YciM
MLMLFLLQPMAANGQSQLLLLILPVLAVFGIFVGVYTARQRSKRRSQGPSS